MRGNLLSRSHRRHRGGVSYPIIIDAANQDKFLISGWSGAGDNISNDKIVLGSELVVNGDFANWTGDDPDGWFISGQVGADPEVSEVGAGQGHGGAGNGLANLFNSAITNQPRIQQNILTVGEWYEIKIDIDTLVARGIQVLDLSAGIVANYLSTGSKANSGLAKNITFAVRPSAGAGADGTVDNVSVKKQTFTSLINTLKPQFGLTDGFFIDIDINSFDTLSAIGVIWNYDGANNFGLAVFAGARLVISKSVVGIYSEIGNVVQSVTPDQTLRIENPVGTNVLDILYNGVSKATPTISDAEIISNTGIALFSTAGVSNKISRVEIGRL